MYLMLSSKFAKLSEMRTDTLANLFRKFSKIRRLITLFQLTNVIICGTINVKGFLVHINNISQKICDQS